MKYKNYVLENRGMTIVALAVTIIVMIILSGVTISTLLGDGGTVEQSKNLRNTEEQEQINTQIQIDELKNKLSANDV